MNPTTIRSKCGLFLQQLIQSGSGSFDLFVQSSHLTDLWPTSSADVCGSECVNVASIITNNQIVQIFVIETLAGASDGAGCFVIVQIYLNWFVVTIEQCVIMFCLHVCAVVVVKMLLYDHMNDQATYCVANSSALWMHASTCAAAAGASVDLTIVYGECVVCRFNPLSRLCTNLMAVSMLSVLITGVLFFNMVYMMMLLLVVLSMWCHMCMINWIRFICICWVVDLCRWRLVVATRLV